ncbi:MAG: Ig-like domain-containing protein [Gammaproteobacteria bacterium]
MAVLVPIGAQAANPKLSWDPNSESNLAGYKLYFGTQSRTCYADPVDERFVYGGGAAAQGGSPITIFLKQLANTAQPSYVLTNLPDAARYFSVTAFNTAGLESRYSGEVALANSPQGPVLCDASAETGTSVEVTYSEYVEDVSATALANYDLRNAATNAAVPVTSITYDYTTFKKVTLNSSALTPGVTYRLSISNVKDYFDPVFITPNSSTTFTYTAGPALRTAMVRKHNPPNIVLEFNKGVSAGTAGVATNYSIDNGLTITQAARGIDQNYTEDQRSVFLTTSSPLVEGTTYTITVNNVTDNLGNAIAANSTITLAVPVDTTPPKALTGHLTNPMPTPLNPTGDRTEVNVTFDEEVDPATATTLTNYVINNGITVGGATLQGDRKTVVLSASSHANGTYQINVSGVRDNSAAMNLMIPTQLSYRVFDATTDTDGDGREDVRDNCKLVQNADQRNTDGDQFGNVCDPDLNNDGVVNFADLAAMKAVFLKADANADLNGDGVVNFADLATLKTMFLKAPGPTGYLQ